MAVSTPKDWWKSSIVYQIKTQSFCDSNEDGIGDILGIVSKLSYLKNLGVDVIWLSEIYPSLKNGNEFDIAKMMSIDPSVGTIADMEKLISKSKRLGIKLILDFIFDDASLKPGSVESSEARYDKYCEVIKFWMDKGVAGFGLDADAYMAVEGQYAKQFGKFKESVLKAYKPFLIGKTSDYDINSNRTKVDVSENELDALLIDEHMTSSSVKVWPFKKRYKPAKLIAALDKWQENIDWPAIYFESADDGRAINKFGNMLEYKNESAKLIASINLSLKGIPFLYQGQELGMTDEGQTFVCDADVEDELYDFYRRMIEFRKTSSALSTGTYRRVASPSDVYVFTRESIEERFYIYCNLTDESRSVEIYGDHLVFDSYRLDDVEEEYLKPYEFRVMKSNF